MATKYCFYYLEQLINISVQTMNHNVQGSFVFVFPLNITIKSISEALNLPSTGCSSCRGDFSHFCFVVCPHLGANKYTEKDSGGMLVWSPYHSIVDSKCKWHTSHPGPGSRHRARLTVRLSLLSGWIYCYCKGEAWLQCGAGESLYTSISYFGLLLHAKMRKRFAFV